MSITEQSAFTLFTMQGMTFFNNQQRLFWLMQVSGWGGWAATFYLGVLFLNDDGPLPFYELYLATVAGIGMLLSLGLRIICRRTWDMPNPLRIVAILAGSYTAGLLWSFSRSVIFFHIAYPQELEKWLAKGDNSPLHYFSNATSAAWVMLVWSAIYVGIKYYLISQEEKQRYLKALSIAHEAQLKMLRYQLNPHFLFNTLNAISTLILDKNTELANSMVTKLSRFLRYSLVSEPMGLVTVKEEVESLKLYLDIEKVRFAERLSLRFDVDEAAESAMVPSLLLQPLAENAIKYAISKSITGGYIAVSAQVVEGQLQLLVMDDGPGLELAFPKPSGSGVGIRNTRERLQQRYGDDQTFELIETDPHGLTVRIRLPLLLDSSTGREDGE